MAPQLMAIKGLPRRALLSWMALAASSLPEPLSPVSSTLASVGPTRSISRMTSCIAGDPPSNNDAAGVGVARIAENSKLRALMPF